jgi:hypothetical protein
MDVEKLREFINDIIDELASAEESLIHEKSSRIRDHLEFHESYIESLRKEAEELLGGDR